MFASQAAIILRLLLLLPAAAADLGLPLLLDLDLLPFDFTLSFADLPFRLMLFWESGRSELYVMNNLVCLLSFLFDCKMADECVCRDDAAAGGDDTAAGIGATVGAAATPAHSYSHILTVPRCSSVSFSPRHMPSPKIPLLYLDIEVSPHLLFKRDLLSSSYRC